MQWHPGKNLLRVLMQSFSFSMMVMRYVFLGSSAYAVGFKNFLHCWCMKCVDYDEDFQREIAGAS